MRQLVAADGAQADFRKFGHQPNGLVGWSDRHDGDPSGRVGRAPVLLSPDVLAGNVTGMRDEMSRFLVPMEPMRLCS